MKFSERVRNHCIAAGHESPHQFYQAPCDDCIDAVGAADLQELLDLISDMQDWLCSGESDIEVHLVRMNRVNLMLKAHSHPIKREES